MFWGLLGSLSLMGPNVLVFARYNYISKFKWPLFNVEQSGLELCGIHVFNVASNVFLPSTYMSAVCLWHMALAWVHGV